MDTDKARVRRIFDEAVEIGAAGRAAFLDRACEEDAGLRDEVEALLLDAWDRGRGVIVGPPKGTILGLVDTYERWERAEPGHGYAEKAASWLARLGAR